MNAVKACASASTLCTLCFIYQIYWSNILKARLHKFLRRGVPFDDGKTSMPDFETIQSNMFAIPCNSSR